jgi:hypothetical protein
MPTAFRYWACALVLIAGCGQAAKTPTAEELEKEAKQGREIRSKLEGGPAPK